MQENYLAPVKCNKCELHCIGAEQILKCSYPQQEGKSLKQPSPQKDVLTFATDSPYKENPYQPKSTEMPPIPEYWGDLEISCRKLLDKQIAADRKWSDDHLEAARKEWAKKEADWLGEELQSVPTVWRRDIEVHIASLRGKK
jgi:hypothetical protein